MPVFSRNRHFFQALLALCLLSVAMIWPGRAATGLARERGDVPSPNELRGCGGAQFPGSQPGFEQEVLRLVNQIRLDNGLLPLKRVDGLQSAARFHATDMSEENYFSHTSYDRLNGQLVESCAWNNRLDTYYTGWNLISENIAAGFATPQAVVDGWMNSPGHRQNILSPHNWETGIGYFTGGGAYGRYWVQDFGRRSGVYPMVINGEDESSDDGLLTIHLYGEWETIRLRVDQGEWSAWQSFASPFQWQLEAAAGPHTVEVEMRSAAGNASASDNISLTQSTIEPALSSLPDALTFYYNPEDANVSPGFHTIQPLEAPVDPSYIWRVSVDRSWLNVTPNEGNGNESVAIVPSVSSASQGDNEHAVVTVSLRRSDGSLIDEKSISVLLAVMDDQHQIFVPVVQGK